MQFVLIKTTVRRVENAFLLMLKYEKEKIATQAKEKVAQFIKTRANNIHEIIDFQGPIMELKRPFRFVRITGIR